MKISRALTDLRFALYTQDSNINEKEVNKLLSELDVLLDKARKLFGLPVKRAVDLFKLWQVNDLPKYLHMKNPPSVMDFDYEAFVSQLNDTIDEARKEFQLVSFGQIVTPGMPSGYDPKSAISKKY